MAFLPEYTTKLDLKKARRKLYRKIRLHLDPFRYTHLDDRKVLYLNSVENLCGVVLSFIRRLETEEGGIRAFNLYVEELREKAELDWQRASDVAWQAFLKAGHAQEKDDVDAHTVALAQQVYATARKDLLESSLGILYSLLPKGIKKVDEERPLWWNLKATCKLGSHVVAALNNAGVTL